MRDNTYINGNNEENPTTVNEDIINNEFGETINTNVCLHSQDIEYEDMNNFMFNKLQTRIGIGFDWSANYDVTYMMH